MKKAVWDHWEVHHKGEELPPVYWREELKKGAKKKALQKYKDNGGQQNISMAQMNQLVKNADAVKVQRKGH